MESRNCSNCGNYHNFAGCNRCINLDCWLPNELETMKHSPKLDQVTTVLQGDSLYQSQNKCVQKVNECITVFNKTMDCADGTLKRLEKMAFRTGAYYDCKQVFVEDGYSAEDSSTYKITHIRSYKNHKHKYHNRHDDIVIQLHLAYSNTTNSGISESVNNASEVELADKMFVAIPSLQPGWFGHCYQNGTKLPSLSDTTDEYDDLYTVGFNIFGKLKWYSNNVDGRMLLQDKIVNSMGCYGIIVADGKITDAALRTSIPNASIQTSRVCMGQNYDTGEIIILTVGIENELGLRTDTAANILAGLGCTVAVELGSGIDAVATDKGTPMFVSATAPKDQLAYWYISRKCEYKEAIQWEIANLFQRFGATSSGMFQLESTMEHVLEEVDNLSTRMDDAEAVIAAIENEIASIQTNIDEIEVNITNIETNISQIENDLSVETQARIDGDNTERSERIAADEALSSRIDASNNSIDEERASREAADTALSAADETLSVALQTEVDIRTSQNSAQDNILTDHETRIDAIEEAPHALPTGGNTGQVLTKNSDADYDIAWTTSQGGEGGDLPAGGTTGQFLRKTGDVDYAAGWETVDIPDNLSGQLSGLSTRIATAETDINNLESTDASMLEYYNALNQKVDTNVTRIDGDISTINTALNSVINNEIPSIKQKNTEQDSSITSINGDITELNGAVGVNTSKITALEAKVKTQQPRWLLRLMGTNIEFVPYNQNGYTATVGNSSGASNNSVILKYKKDGSSGANGEYNLYLTFERINERIYLYGIEEMTPEFFTGGTRPGRIASFLFNDVNFQQAFRPGGAITFQKGSASANYTATNNDISFFVDGNNLVAPNTSFKSDISQIIIPYYQYNPDNGLFTPNNWNTNMYDYKN